MSLLFPIASGVATILTVALSYETGKGTYQKIQRKRNRRARNKS